MVIIGAKDKIPFGNVKHVPVVYWLVLRKEGELSCAECETTICLDDEIKDAQQSSNLITHKPPNKTQNNHSNGLRPGSVSVRTPDVRQVATVLDDGVSVT